MNRYGHPDAVNWSTLKFMAKSPAHYLHALEQGTETTDAMDLGTVTHLAVFEPEKLATHVAIWDGKQRRGAEWEGFCLAAGAKLVVRRRDYELACKMGASARKAAGKLLSEGQSEVVLEWTHRNGLLGKGKVDHISRGFGIIDLKSCSDASPEVFGRAAARLGYHVQAAEYVDGAELSGKWGALPYTLLAVESKPPFVAVPYTVTLEQLELGRETYLPLLDKVAECRRTGEWPGYAPSVLTLPRWATFDPSEEDVAAVGLKFEEA